MGSEKPQPIFGSWQSAQETLASPVIFVSKKSSLPSSTLAADIGLSVGTGTAGRGASGLGLGSAARTPVAPEARALPSNNASSFDVCFNNLYLRWVGFIVRYSLFNFSHAGNSATLGIPWEQPPLPRSP